MRGVYRVRKKSGIQGIKSDHREWRLESLMDAEEEYNRKLKTKTNLKRKSPRKYALVAGEAPKMELTI
jgi:hypothetical protein